MRAHICLTATAAQLFYKIDLLMLSGDNAGALQFLLQEEAHCVEKRRVRELHVTLLLALGRPADAVALAAELLRINSEDLRYHAFVQQSRQVAGNADALFALYAGELQKQFPRSAACQRIPLDFLGAADARFTQQFTAYYRRLLEKGAPSGACCYHLPPATLISLCARSVWVGQVALQRRRQSGRHGAHH